MKRFMMLMIVVLAASFCSGAEQPAQPPARAVTISDNDFWKEDWGPDSFPRIPEDRINQILLQIRNQNPARADELEKLRKENPDAFRSQLRMEVLRLYQQPAGPAAQDGPAKGGPQGPAAQARPPQPGGSRPEPGSPERWRERWERKHDDFVVWLDKNYPPEAIALKQIRDKEPDKYMERVMEKMHTYDPIREAERRNPKLAQLMKDDLEQQKQRDALLKQIHSANEKDKEKLMTDLKDNVSRRFDIIMARKQIQYDDLKTRLQELQKEVQKQEKDLDKLKNNKDNAVKEHLDELTQKAEKMQWD